MKLIKTLISALFLSLLFVSCEKEDDGYGNGKDNNLNGNISVMPDDDVIH